MTTAADLRAQVTFAARITVSDEYGATTGGFEDRFTVRARIWPRLGGETVLAARLSGTQPVTITVRESPDTREIRP
jgi:head-tail adaptor